MTKKLTQFLLITSAITLGACGTAPIKAKFLSDEKNIWVEEVDAGLSYCMSSSGGPKEIDPVCYPARRADKKDVKYTPAADIAPLSGTKETKSDKAP